MQQPNDPEQTWRLATDQPVERRTAMSDRRKDERRASPDRRREERRSLRSLLRL